jgi:hypothetical protein
MELHETKQLFYSKRNGHQIEEVEMLSISTCFLLAIWTSSFKKALFSSFSHVFHWAIIFWGVEFFELPEYSGY